MEDRKVKQIHYRDGYQWERGGHKKEGMRVNMMDVFCIHV
jgi:hypothetical protein